MNFDQERLLSLICAIPAFVAGLTFHEFAHAWAGDRLGDDTPRRMGRLTLDPMAHIDAFGAIFFILAWFSGFGLGWAKPVPIQPRNMAHPRRDSLLVAIAGPISNLLQMPFWLAGLFAFGFVAGKSGWAFTNPTAVPTLIMQALLYGVVINVGLAAFNMIPIPPLDGHWVLQALGGRPLEILFDQIRPYSFILLIALINFTPILRWTLGPIQNAAENLALHVVSSGIALALR